MPSDRDIYALAKSLITIKSGKEGAIEHCAKRRAELLQEGANTGAAMWVRVIDAINDLSNIPPPDGTTRH